MENKSKIINISLNDNIVEYTAKYLLNLTSDIEMISAKLPLL